MEALVLIGIAAAIGIWIWENNKKKARHAELGIAFENGLINVYEDGTIEGKTGWGLAVTHERSPIVDLDGVDTTRNKSTAGRLFIAGATGGMNLLATKGTTGSTSVIVATDAWVHDFTATNEHDRMKMETALRKALLTNDRRNRQPDR